MNKGMVRHTQLMESNMISNHKHMIFNLGVFIVFLCIAIILRLSQ